MSTIPEILQAGVRLHRGGQREEAAQIYRQVLAIDPNSADALNLLGLASRETGLFAEAVEHLRKAIAVDHSQAAFFANLGEAYRGLGRLDEAIENYEHAIRLQPTAAIAHFHLGTLLEQSGLVERAIASYERVLSLEPQFFEALGRLGLARRDQGDLAAAEDCFRRAIQVQPNAADAHFDLGNTCQMQNRNDEAIAHFREAVRLRPDFAAAMCNLGHALHEQGKHSEAGEHLERAVALQPDLAVAHSMLGAVLQELGRVEEAQQRFERAVELEPRNAQFLRNLGIAFKARGEIEQAIVCFERALEAQPGYAAALVSRGTARLSLGQFAEGWADYEHRPGCPEYNTLQFEQPLWDGSPLEDRRLLIHCEQGLGDTLQFIRYLPLVRNRAAHVTVAADAWLVPLLIQSGYAPVIANDEPLPPFDVHAPLMSLPHIFGTQLDSVPADVPYLAVDAARAEHWRAELERYPGFKIGIAWQGRPGFRGDRLRSMRLEQFAPLAQVAGVRLISLQKGPGSEQVAALEDRFELVDLGPAIDNQGGAFLDTSAVMQRVDLVITSDTAIAHLAGALGVPVWVALSCAPDWRWMFDRDDSPWYPTMRLFRQQELGQWGDVFDRMAEELRVRVRGD